MSTLLKIIIALAVLLTGTLLFFVFRAPLADGPQQSQQLADFGNLEGDWVGTLNAGGTELRVVFHLVQDENGRLTGTWDSVDQDALGLPISSLVVHGDQIEIGMEVARASFEGVISLDGTEILGTWKQSGNELPLTLEPLAAPITFERPQEPKPPFDYNVEELTFPNASAGIDLAGTLTTPVGDGPFPAAVLISGSGPQDRNEQIFGHKPFLVLSDYLTRHGIAVLRYDDRGFGESTGEFGTATSADFATDAWAAVQYLLTRDEIDPSKIGLVGHSEGGLIAPIVAADHPEIAYIVLMAGPGVTGEEILLIQTEAIQRVNGASADVIQLTRRVNESIFAIIKAEPDNEIAKERITALVEELSDEDRQKINMGPDVLEVQIEQLTSPWIRYFLTYDPAPTLERLTLPVLAINGSSDLQVDPKINLAAIEDALKRGGNTQFEVIEYGGLNHLFQPSETGNPAEYINIEETISPQILEKISQWIAKQTSSS